MTATYITFGLYLLVPILIGTIFFLKVTNVEGFLLGKRKMGGWVTALSAQTSDRGYWLLLGLPMLVYTTGLCNIWLAAGLAAGTLFNWILVAPRLRAYTGQTKSLTLAAFFQRRFRDPSGLLRILTAAGTLFFFTVYAAVGLMLTGKMLESIGYQPAVMICGGALLLYVMMGGYPAVCWTDFFLGLLMFIAIVAVPVTAMISLPPGALASAIASRDTQIMNPMPPGGTIAIISMVVWGLGYFGQPHILTRFMGAKPGKLSGSTLVAMIWLLISLAGAICIGLLAIPMFYDTILDEGGEVFPYMIGRLFNPRLYPWIGGTLAAVFLGSILATIDSQVMVCTSTLTEDLYKGLLRRRASTEEQVCAARFFVILVTVVAVLIALYWQRGIFDLFGLGWGGLGAAFGPVVLMALYSRRTSWVSALLGMLAAVAVMVFWYLSGYNEHLYGILPGFAAGLFTIIIFNLILPQKNAAVLRGYDRMLVRIRMR